MSAISPLPISQRITNPLKEVAQRQWTVLAVKGVLQTLVVSLGVLLIASLLLGYMPNIPAILRVILALGVWGTVIWSAIRSLPPALHRWTLSHAAQFVEEGHPESQERISSAVELSQTEDQFRGSPELVAHLVKQAEGDAERVNASAVVSFNTIYKWTAIFLPILILWLFFAINSHTNFPLLRGLFGTLMPWRAVPGALADVNVTPGDTTVAQGDSLNIVATVSTGGKQATHANLIKKFSTNQQLSQNLAQTQAREFSVSLDNLQQSFKYKVNTDRGESPWYTVTVNPRPAIARLDVHYDFPKYTAIDSKTFTAGDGNVDAVIGTKITLSIHTTNSLVSGKSQLLFDEGKPTQSVVALTATSEKNVYQAKFDVARSGEYRIKLLNEYNLANKDDDARAVTAELDLPPVVSIVSPKDQITVRPDDDVTVRYLAGDDYGVAHIDAIIQVDDRPERTIPVTIHSKDRKNIKDQWTLSVPAIVKLEGVAEATHITYQLKATDNRDPDPQNALSAKQTLLVSKRETKSFQEKLNEKRKEDLQAAIRKAIDRLREDEWKTAALIARDARRPVLAEETQQVTDTRDHLTTTGKDLAATASEYLDTPFAEVAKGAKEVAEKPIAKSADDVARVALDNDNAVNRKADADRAHTEIIDARTQLEKLLLKAEEAAKKAEAAEALKDAAKKQEEVAKDVKEHPEKAEENRQKQQEAINKLQEALQKDQAIQNPQAQQLAAKLAELENKVEQEQAQQTQLQNDAAKQEEKQQAQDAANALAQEQKKLNEEVKQFAKDDKAALDQAKAPAPDAAQQDNLVKEIEKNQLQQAAQDAQKQADQLKEDAQKLKQDAAKPDANAAATPQQQAQQKQDQQNQQAAQNDQNQANQAAQNLQNQEKNNQPQADAAQQAAQKAEAVAQQIEKQADAIKQQDQQGANNADAQAAADAAKADAQQADKDAQAAAQAQNPQDAQKAADKAAQELAKAAKELTQAAQAEAKADQQAAQAQNAQADAAAADQAQALADKQEAIAQALQQQAAQQADAAAAPAPQQDAAKQEALAQQTQQAQQAAQQLAQQAQAQQDPALAQRAEKAADALQQAAQAQQEAAKADAANKPADAAQAQADAQQALAKADQALRGAPDPAQAQANADPAQAGQPDAAQGQPDAGKADPAQGQPDAGKPDAAQGQPDAGKPEQGQGQGQPQQTTAQAAQEAAQAQQQAQQQQPNPGAAQEAAQALAQAAQQAEQGLPGQPEQGQGPPEQGHEPGNEPGQHTGTVPHPGADPKEGITGADAGGENKPPAAVQALGISASDWAKLPPLMQKELMNASQQSGPPAYKEMIKNYYIRVAHLQNERPEPSRKQ